jgi:hypothetical protein
MDDRKVRKEIGRVVENTELYRVARKVIDEESLEEMVQELKQHLCTTFINLHNQSTK